MFDQECHGGSVHYLDLLAAAQCGSCYLSIIFDVLFAAAGAEFFNILSIGPLAISALEPVWPGISRSETAVILGVLAPSARKNFWSFVEASLVTTSLTQFEQHLIPSLQQVLGQEMSAGGVAVFADSRAIHVANFTFPDVFIQRGLQGSHYRSPLSQAWRQHCRPQYFELGASKARSPEAWGVYRDFGIKNVLGHGVPDIQGGCASFFGFAQVPEKLEVHHAQSLELLIPYLHIAFQRSLQAEGKLPPQPFLSPISTAEAAKPKLLHSPPALPAQQLISLREREILHWMSAGKSNWDIGVILKISECTVKNHVQNILKKLQASNRSHAVAKALSLGLLNP